jgi:hypothetical protein
LGRELRSNWGWEDNRRRRIGVVVGWGRKGREVVGLGWNRMLGIGRTAEEEERCQLGPKGSQGRIAEEERSRKEEVGRRAIG